MYGFPVGLMARQTAMWKENSAPDSRLRNALTNPSTGRFIGQSRRFRCVAENARNLLGFCGSPIFDIELDCVVGVPQHKYGPVQPDGEPRVVQPLSIRQRRQHETTHASERRRL